MCFAFMNDDTSSTVLLIWFPSHLFFRVDLLHGSHFGHRTLIRHNHIWATAVVHQSNATTQQHLITSMYLTNHANALRCVRLTLEIEQIPNETALHLQWWSRYSSPVVKRGKNYITVLLLVFKSIPRIGMSLRHFK